MLRSYVAKFPWPFSSVWQKFSRNRQVVNVPSVAEKEQSVIRINVQALLTWQNKTHSSIALTLTYVALWLVYWALQQPYYVVSMVALSWLLRDVWYNYIWPEISVPAAANRPSVFSRFQVSLGTELSAQLRNYVQKLEKIATWAGRVREDNHALFSSVLSLILIAAAVVGYFIPGLVLAHVVFVLVWATSCGMSVTRSVSALYKPVIGFDEFVPNLSGDEMQVLEKACEACPVPAPSTDASFLDLPSIPPIDETDTTLKAEEDLNFVPMHFNYQDLSPEAPTDEFIPSTFTAAASTMFPRQILNLAEDVITKGKLALGLSADQISDSPAEDFEILSHSDFEQ